MALERVFFQNFETRAPQACSKNSPVVPLPLGFTFEEKEIRQNFRFFQFFSRLKLYIKNTDTIFI